MVEHSRVPRRLLMQGYDSHGNTTQAVNAAGAWSQVQRVAPPQPSPFDVAQWLVYVEGGSVVGPVSANQVARGIKAGRIPSEASIQAVGEVFWTGLFDEPVVIAALKSL